MLAVAGDEALKFRIGIVKHVCSAFRWKEPHGVALTCQARYVSRCRDCSTEFAFQALAPVRGFGFSGGGSGLTFCCAGFEVLVDNVLEPGILSALAAIRLERRGKLLFLNKPADVLTRKRDALVGEVLIAQKSHRGVPCYGDEHFVASGSPSRLAVQILGT